MHSFLQEVTPDKIPQTFSEFWKTDVRSRRGKNSRLEDEQELLEEGAREFGLDGTVLQGLFEEAARDEEMKQLRRWVAAGQDLRTGRRPYRSYNVVAGRGEQGPGVRLNKATLLRQQKLREKQEEAETDTFPV